MNAAAGCELLGRWRIVEADLWDHGYLDLVEPAYMTFAKNGRDEFAFGAVNATMELGYGQRIVFFNWTGSDEGDEIYGSGSAELEDDGTSRLSYPFTTAMTRSEGASRMISSTACQDDRGFASGST